MKFNPEESWCFCTDTEDCGFQEKVVHGPAKKYCPRCGKRLEKKALSLEISCRRCPKNQQGHIQARDAYCTECGSKLSISPIWTPITSPR